MLGRRLSLSLGLPLHPPQDVLVWSGWLRQLPGMLWPLHAPLVAMAPGRQAQGKTRGTVIIPHREIQCDS